MQNNQYSEKLCKTVLMVATILFIGFLCYYFSGVLVYIVIAGIISLISSPIMKLFGKIKIKGKAAPKWLMAIFSLIIIMGMFLVIITSVVPVVGNIIKEISNINLDETAHGLTLPLANLNHNLIEAFPSLGEEFRIELFILKELQKLLDFSMFSSIIGSVASTIANAAIGCFCVIFISFFFIKDDTLLTRIITALTPDRHEENMKESLHDVQYLLSRYFVGVLIEMSGVAILNFLGLWLITRLNFEYAIGIAFLTGILNIIPYVGPLIGGCLGTIMGLIIKYCCVGAIGLDVNFWAFALILIGIFLFTQLIDNFIYQPIIYSNSIKANPLEIFIVLLIAATIGGIVGMLVAIPSYTVIRVILGRFFRDVKAIRLLINSKENTKP